MSIPDNSAASSAAASELPAAPLDGIELQPEGAAEHLPNASAEAGPEHLPDASGEAAPEHLSDAPAEASPQPHCLRRPGRLDYHFALAQTGVPAAFAQTVQRRVPKPVLPPALLRQRPKGARNRVTRAVEAD
jgi:hypothetical protein